MILHTGQNSQLSFYADASGMSVFYDLSGQLHIFIKGKGGAVDHDRGIASLYGCHAGVKVSAVIQMEHHRNGCCLSIFFYCAGNISGSDLLILQSSVDKIRISSHKAICQIRPLQDSCRAEHFMNLYDCLCLSNRIYVKCSLAEAVFHGSLQKRPQGN